MRILWDSGNVGFGGCGINEWDRHVIKNLRGKGHDVVLLVDKNLKRRPKFKTWKEPEGGYTFIDDRITPHNYRSIVDSLGKFDVQIGNHFTMFPVLDSVLPVVFDVNIKGRKDYSRGIVASLRGLMTLTDHFLCATSYTQDQLLSLNSEVKTSVTWGGAKPLPGGKALPPTDKPYIAYWGNRYGAEKNFLSLVKTLKYHDLDLCVSGFLPPSTQELDLVEELKLKDRVHFFTNLDDEELGNMISGAKMYVCPSKYEGLGLPPIEAMGIGLPVVSSPCASLPSVVGDCGVITDSANAKDLTKGILKVLSDPQKTQERVYKGLEKVKLWTWDNTADIILQTAHELLNSK